MIESPRLGVSAYEVYGGAEFIEEDEDNFRILKRNHVLSWSVEDVQKEFQHLAPGSYNGFISFARRQTPSLMKQHNCTHDEAFATALKSLYIYKSSLYKKDCRTWLYKSTKPNEVLDRSGSATREGENITKVSRDVPGRGRKRMRDSDEFQTQQRWGRYIRFIETSDLEEIKETSVNKYRKACISRSETSSINNGDLCNFRQKRNYSKNCMHPGSPYSSKPNPSSAPDLVSCSSSTNDSCIRMISRTHIVPQSKNSGYFTEISNHVQQIEENETNKRAIFQSASESLIDSSCTDKNKRYDALQRNCSSQIFYFTPYNQCQDENRNLIRTYTSTSLFNTEEDRANDMQRASPSSSMESFPQWVSPCSTPLNPSWCDVTRDCTSPYDLKVELCGPGHMTCNSHPIGYDSTNHSVIHRMTSYRDEPGAIQEYHEKHICEDKYNSSCVQDKRLSFISPPSSPSPGVTPAPSGSLSGSF